MAKIKLSSHPNYDLLTTEQLHNAYDRLSEDLHLIAKGSGSIAWKRETIAKIKTRIDVVLALIVERATDQEAEATQATAEFMTYLGKASK